MFPGEYVLHSSTYFRQMGGFKINLEFLFEKLQALEWGFNQHSIHNVDFIEFLMCPTILVFHYLPLLVPWYLNVAVYFRLVMSVVV